MSRRVGTTPLDLTHNGQTLPNGSYMVDKTQLDLDYDGQTICKSSRTLSLTVL